MDKCQELLFLPWVGTECKLSNCAAFNLCSGGPRRRCLYITVVQETKVEAHVMGLYRIVAVIGRQRRARRSSSVPIGDNLKSFQVLFCSKFSLFNLIIRISQFLL
jgi:hypothetical protein